MILLPSISHLPAIFKINQQYTSHWYYYCFYYQLLFLLFFVRQFEETAKNYARSFLSRSLDDETVVDPFGGFQIMLHYSNAQPLAIRELSVYICPINLCTFTIKLVVFLCEKTRKNSRNSNQCIYCCFQAIAGIYNVQKLL